MDMTVLFSIGRQILLVGGMELVRRGFMDEATMTGMVGAVVTLATSVFMIMNAKKAAAASK